MTFLPIDFLLLLNYTWKKVLNQSNSEQTFNKGYKTVIRLNCHSCQKYTHLVLGKLMLHRFP